MYNLYIPGKKFILAGEILSVVLMLVGVLMPGDVPSWLMWTIVGIYYAIFLYVIMYLIIKGKAREYIEIIILFLTVGGLITFLALLPIPTN